MKDYEVLRRELPGDIEVAESLSQAQAALSKSWEEETYSVKFGGEVEEVSGVDQFKAAISSPGEPSYCIKLLLIYMHLLLSC